MAKRKKPKGWSYNAGEKGRNWVRVYEDSRDGKLYAEWFEEVADSDTRVVRRKRQRMSLSKHGITTRAAAVEKAEAMAERFGELSTSAPTASEPLTLARLLTHYNQEVTPTYGPSQRKHDRRAKRVFLAFFDAQAEAERRSGRHPSTLDRTDWERFCTWRSEGRIAGFGPVRSRAVEYDLKYMIKVLNWATGVQKDGAPLLEGSPWSAERRRTQKWRVPKEKSPKRPAMTPELRAQLLEHSPNWQFALALELGYETFSRNSSVRQLRWTDVDLEARTVRWRREAEKSGVEVVTPLSDRAVELLKKAPSRGIGEAWVFPSEADPHQPTGDATFQTWMRRAKKRAGIQVERLGFHAEKRASVREARSLSPKALATLSRTRYETLVSVYDAVSVEEMREEMERRRRAN